MSNVNDKLIAWLFETSSIKVCPENKPFWYTSNTIGPFYVNTQYLYGNQQKADELLKFIDVETSNKINCSEKILIKTKYNYENDDIYKGLIDMMVSFIKETMDINDINFISGGERRDWFFSLIIADKLKKPHITLFKDHSATLFENGKSIILKDIRTLKLGQNILHVADIITIASSYKNAWIPAINKLGGMIVKSLVVVDRMQGGKDYLATEGIESYALINMDISVFEKARDMGLLSNEQLSMIVKYYQSPIDSMRKFLIEHPEFLEQSLKCDGRDAERARNCVDRDIYGIYL